jgi:hypothetical protein
MWCWIAGCKNGSNVDQVKPKYSLKLTAVTFRELSSIRVSNQLELQIARGHPYPTVASSVRPLSSGSSTIRTWYANALACHARDYTSTFSGRSRPAASSCLIWALMFKYLFWPARGQNVAFALALPEPTAYVVMLNVTLARPIKARLLQPHLEPFTSSL